MAQTSSLNNIGKGIAGLVSLAMLAVPTASFGQGDLLIAPTRLTMNGGGGSEVILSNIGSKAATYRISLELRRMREDGQIEEVAEANATPAEKATLAMVRYAPRRILLEPNQPQSIRVSARPPAELANGEYRVHMSFKAIPDAISVENSQPETTPTGLTINLTPIYGITIPLIIRKGQLEGGAAISNPALVTEAGNNFLRMEMARSGNRSVFGEIRVIPRGGREPVFMARGIAIYPEVNRRNLKLPVSAEQAAKMRGPMQIEYRELPENGGKLISAFSATLG